jgi:predicted permease
MGSRHRRSPAAFGSAQVASPANTGGCSGAAPIRSINDLRRSQPARDWHAARSGSGLMTHVLADLRLAAASLARAPLFSLVAVVSIALGIGANTAVFTLLDQVALRPLPIRDPAALVQVHARGEESYGGTMGNGTELSWPMFLDFRSKAPGFDGVVGRVLTQLHVGQHGVSERTDGELVSGNYFEVLGVEPALGRVFTSADDATISGHPLAVLGYDYWRRRFGGRVDILGQVVQINGHPFTVIGVAARGFYGLELGTPADVFVPLTMQPQLGPAWLKLDGRRFRWVQVYARLQPGTTAERAQAGLQPLFSAILQTEAQETGFQRASAATREQFLKSRIQVVDARHGQSEMRRQLGPSLQILMAIAAGVLLIACANVANLLIARGAARERELALRRALGASGPRLAWLLIAEAAVLTIAGSLAGLLIATWGANLLVDMFTTSDTTVVVAASPDWRIVAFTALAAMVTALLSGLAPAVRAVRGGVAAALKAAGGGVVREQPRLRKSLVVVQVGLSFLMIVAAALFVRSLDNLLQVHPGFSTERVTSFTVDLERSGYTDERSRVFGQELLDRLQALPGVEAAGFATFGILEGGGWGMGFTVEGFAPKPGEAAGSLVNAVSPGYLEAMRAPIVRGRAFTMQDSRMPATGEDGWPYRTAIVNETFVRRYFDGRDPIGRHVGFGGDPGTPTPITIVGVVADAKYQAIREDTIPQILLPAFENRGLNNVTVYVRSRLPTAALVANARGVVRAMDPGMPVFNVATLDERVARSLRNERLVAGLSAAFATLATLLGLIGLYGVMAYTVTRRAREIGIRMALGARAAAVAGGVVREAALLVAGGLVLAAPLAWWLKRFIATELYGIAATDPRTIALAAVGLTAVGLLAAAVPARRAAHIDPMRALRDE